MYIERILCPIVTLGPGKRLVIWTKGCSKKCPGCISPEMAEIGNSRSVEVDVLFKIIKSVHIREGFDGITISGGDPFEQLTELLGLLERLREITDDILVYTGFVWEVFSKTLNIDVKGTLEKTISVLIDGPYVHEKNRPGLALKGSDNQKIIFFDEGKRETYDIYMKDGRGLQNVIWNNKLLTIGIMDA